MANIQFEEESRQHSYRQPEQKPFFVRFVLSLGIVSTDKAAEYFLVGTAMALFLLAATLYQFAGREKLPLTNQDIERITQLQQGLRGL